MLRAASSMNPYSTGGPESFSPRLLRLLALTSISPEAGVTGLSALNRLFWRLGRGDIPDQTVLLIFATLIPYNLGRIRLGKSQLVRLYGVSSIRYFSIQMLRTPAYCPHSVPNLSPPAWKIS